MHDPRVPETLEGWSLLHQMFRIRWSEWRALPADARAAKAAEAAQCLADMQRGAEGTTVPVTMLGHKGDLMLVHFRRTFEALQAAQLQAARLGLSAYLDASTSYVSMVELGMYEMTAIMGDYAMAAIMLRAVDQQVPNATESLPAIKH